MTSYSDSIREMTKYSGEFEHSGSRHVDSELQHSMKLFRAQRNFYIAGFALFLLLVIKKLVTLITQLAQLDIQSEAYMKQAKSASEAAKAAMKDNSGKSSSGDKSSGDSKEIAELKKQLKEKEAELVKSQTNEEALKKQAKNISDEYDRLNKELKKQQSVSSSSGEKKDN